MTKIEQDNPERPKWDNGRRLAALESSILVRRVREYLGDDFDDVEMVWRVDRDLELKMGAEQDQLRRTYEEEGLIEMMEEKDFAEKLYQLSMVSPEDGRLLSLTEWWHDGGRQGETRILSINDYFKSVDGRADLQIVTDKQGRVVGEFLYVDKSTDDLLRGGGMESFAVGLNMEKFVWKEGPIELITKEIGIEMGEGVFDLEYCYWWIDDEFRLVKVDGEGVTEVGETGFAYDNLIENLLVFHKRKVAENQVNIVQQLLKVKGKPWFLDDHCRHLERLDELRNETDKLQLAVEIDVVSGENLGFDFGELVDSTGRSLMFDVLEGEALKKAQVKLEGRFPLVLASRLVARAKEEPDLLLAGFNPNWWLGSILYEKEENVFGGNGGV